MQAQRRLVTEDALLLTPEPEDDQVFMLACRVVREAVDASAGALQASLLHVMGQERQRVAGLLRLPRGDVAPLPGGDFIELSPMGWTRAMGLHARMLNPVEHSCKGPSPLLAGRELLHHAVQAELARHAEAIWTFAA
jgi:hypothetical protein